MEGQIRELSIFPESQMGSFSIEFSPNARYVALSGHEGQLTVWDRTEHLFSSFQFEFENLLSLAWSPVQPIIACLNSYDSVFLTSINRNFYKEIPLDDCFSNRDSTHFSTSSISWSPNGSLLAIAVYPSNILIVNHESIIPACSELPFSDDRPEIASIVWNKKNNLIYAAYGQDINIYGLDSQFLRRFHHSDYLIEIFKIDRSFKKIAVVYEGQTFINIFDISGQLIKLINIDLEICYAIAWSPNSRFVAVGGQGDTISIINIMHPNHVISIPCDDVVFSLDWSPDGSLLAVSYCESISKVYELEVNVFSDPNHSI